MSGDYISKEVDKIILSNDFDFPQNLAMASAWIMAHYKGLNLKILNIGEKSSLADFFILGSATNMVQVRAIADALIGNLKRHGRGNVTCEGMDDGNWVLIDSGDIIIHIFLDTMRGTFDLDDLWRDVPEIEIPASYYFDALKEESANEDEGDKGYF